MKVAVKAALLVATLECSLCFQSKTMSTRGPRPGDGRFLYRVENRRPSPIDQSNVDAAAEQAACLGGSRFAFNASPRTLSLQWKLMSTPQFSYEPSGFAARCDWVIGNRYSHYGKLPLNASWGDPASHPRTIFVRTDLVSDFYDTVLPCLTKAFVLVTGDHDVTIPRQIDSRYPKYLSHQKWKALVNHRLVLHVFSENLDEPMVGVSGIPLGVNPGEFAGRDGDAMLSKIAGTTSISQRVVKVLNCDRQRDGSQFVDRRHVLELCDTSWKGLCVPQSNISRSGFFKHVQRYPFILCVHGGGLDPSPKAWEALMAGTIPIMQHYAGDDAYRELPVVFVDNWAAETITEANLQSWLLALAPYFEDEDRRREVVRRLHSEYWWAKVENVLRTRGRTLTKRDAMSIEWRAPVPSESCQYLNERGDCVPYKV
jgi:hypothetical protein